MRVLELPKPLIPLNPLTPPRQPRLPKALGDVFVGNPRLTFPEVTAPTPQDKPAVKATSQEQPPVKEAPPSKNPYAFAAQPLGQQLDVNA
jgi:hypothetical protein